MVSEKDPLISVSPISAVNATDDWGDHHKHSKDEGFGDKSIGWFGSFTLLVNNITGPGMVSIPLLFQNAGWLTTSLCFAICCLFSTFSATMACEAMSRIPGNARFDDRIELTTIAQYYFNRVGFYITLLLFTISLQAVNIASIIVSAQTMDLALVKAFSKWFGTCALEFYPNPGFVCESHTAHMGNSPFGDGTVVISLGFIIVLLISIPLGYYNLEDNIIVQKVTWMLFMVILVLWYSFFVWDGMDFGDIKAVGKDQSQVIGTILFNYAFVVSVPSWVNEKKREIPINKSIWISTVFSTLIFLSMGFMGAWAFKYKEDQDLLAVIDEDVKKHINSAFHDIIQITVYLFPLATQISSIPVFSIIIRYNLIENGICRKFWANIWAVVFPWVVSLPFYTGSGLQNVINWTSLFVNAIINFIIPLMLYIQSRRTQPKNLQLEPDHFVAVPEKFKPLWIALVGIIVLSIMITLAIILNILSAANVNLNLQKLQFSRRNDIQLI